jgi:uncharacterized protein
MKNAINWFEIPVADFERALTFYSKVLNTKIEEMPFPEGRYGIIAYDDQGVGGGLVYGHGYEPSDKGAIVYLNGGEDLNDPLSRVEEAGGKVVLSKTPIGSNGFMAFFMDTEGNKVALHSMG